jgi:O-antigen/teichoic acid export membrane protein
MLRAFSITSATRIFRLLVGLGLTSLLGRYLGSQGFGEISVAMAIVSTLICIGELGLGRYTVREILVSADGEAATLGTTLGMRLRIGLVLFALLTAYVALIQPKGWLLIMIYGVQILTSPLTELLCWFEARGMVERLAVAQLLGFLASAVCIVIGVWQKLPLWYFAVTYVFECWSALAIALVLFHRHGGSVRLGHYSKYRALELFRRSWFELVSQLALLLLFRVDAIMVGSLRGEREAGLYSAAVRVSEVVYFIPAILASVSLSRLIALKKVDATAYQQRVVEYFSLSFIIALSCAGALVLGSPAVGWLFGPDFTGGSSILVVHAWSFIPYTIGVTRTQYLIAEDRLSVNLPSVATALVLNIGLNWMWIPRYGGLGAAWATLVAYSVAWVASSFVLPGAREVSGLMLRGIAEMPTSLALAWRQLRHSLSRV